MTTQTPPVVLVPQPTHLQETDIYILVTSNMVHRVLIAMRSSERWGSFGFIAPAQQGILDSVSRTLDLLYSHHDFKNVDAYQLVLPFASITSPDISAGSMIINAVLDFYEVLFTLFSPEGKNVSSAVRFVLTSLANIRVEVADIDSDSLILSKVLKITENCIASPLGYLLSDWHIAQSVFMCFKFSKPSMFNTLATRMQAESTYIKIAWVLMRDYCTSDNQPQQTHSEFEQKNIKQKNVDISRSTTSDFDDQFTSSKRSLPRSSSASDLSIHNWTVIDKPSFHLTDPPRGYRCLSALTKVSVEMCNPEKYESWTKRMIGIKLVSELLKLGNHSPVFEYELEQRLFVYLFQNVRVLINLQQVDFTKLSQIISLLTVIVLSSAKQTNNECSLAFLSLLKFEIGDIDRREFSLYALRSLFSNERFVIELFSRLDSTLKWDSTNSAPSCLRSICLILCSSVRKDLNRFLMKENTNDMLATHVANVSIDSAKNFAESSLLMHNLKSFLLTESQDNAFLKSASHVVQKQAHNLSFTVLETLLETVHRLSNIQAKPSNINRNHIYRIENLRKIKHILHTGIEMFNKKPRLGIDYLCEENLLEKPLVPKAVAEFLLSIPDLDKQIIGDYLSTKTEFHHHVLVEYIRSFDLSRAFIYCFRDFIESFILPGDSNLINLIVECFGGEYFNYQKAHNPNEEMVFENSDACYVLAYSIIMLNTDQHNKDIKNRMTCPQFVNNLRGTNDGKDFPAPFLEEIYQNIQSHALLNVSTCVVFPMTVNNINDILYRDRNRSFLANSSSPLPNFPSSSSLASSSLQIEDEEELTFDSLKKKFATKPSFYSFFDTNVPAEVLVKSGIVKQIFDEVWTSTFDLIWSEFELTTNSSHYSELSGVLLNLIATAELNGDSVSVNAIVNALCIRTRLLPYRKSETTERLEFGDNNVFKSLKTQSKSHSRAVLGTDVKAQFALLIFFTQLRDTPFDSSLSLIIPVIGCLYTMGFFDQKDAQNSFATYPIARSIRTITLRRSPRNTGWLAGLLGIRQTEDENSIQLIPLSPEEKAFENKAQESVNKCAILDFVNKLFPLSKKRAHWIFIGAINCIQLFTCKATEDFAIFGINIMIRVLCDHFTEAYYQKAKEVLFPYLTMKEANTISGCVTVGMFGLSTALTKKKDEKNMHLATEFIDILCSQSEKFLSSLSILLYDCLSEVGGFFTASPDKISQTFRKKLLSLLKVLASYELKAASDSKNKYFEMCCFLLSLDTEFSDVRSCRSEIEVISYFSQFMIHNKQIDNSKALINLFEKSCKNILSIDSDDKWDTLYFCFNEIGKLSTFKDPDLDLKIVSSLQSLFFSIQLEQTEKSCNNAAQLFSKSLFPFLELLLQINESRATSNCEINLCAISLLSKTFLHFSSVLVLSSKLLEIWDQILKISESFITKCKSESVTESIREALKNIMLVIKSSGNSEETPELTLFWERSKKFCDQFLPGLTNEL